MSPFRHGGHLADLSRRSGIPRERIIDFSANMNPLGPPEWLRAVVSSSLGDVINYPDPDCSGLKSAAAGRYNVNPEQILAGNGSTELIYLLPQALGIGRAVIPVPSYVDYAGACEAAKVSVELPVMSEESGFTLDVEAIRNLLQGGEAVFIGHPNNPTGIPVDRDRFRDLAEAYPDTYFILDEAFIDLADGIPSFIDNRPANVIVLVSLTKTFAVAGLRLGIAVADEDVVRKVEALQPPWSVNTVAQKVGEAALDDISYIKESRVAVRALREKLVEDLSAIDGLKVFPGKADYLLVKIEKPGIDAVKLAERTLERGIAIRVCANYHGLDEGFFRVAVRSADDNGRLIETLGDCLGAKAVKRVPTRTPAIMFQGTSSNAGKSVLTAALCRILLQDGYRVAPFKAQNMSLNSFVTLNGEEMGRAQVVQAHAARLEPDVRMNPVLLKPSSDTGSQVIVLGKPVGNMDVDGYVSYKPKAFKAACEAYEGLASEFDILVMEGAGSPGEVNLKHHDIVNMTMARYAGAPVILVGDIDRGGVFASFVGTMEVLAEWERALVKGFVVNRFRGQESLLQPAFDYVKRHTGADVLGTVPFIQDLGIPEEDSVTFKSGFFNRAAPEGDYVEIAVVDLPHISNFTDFDALRLEPDVHVRIVNSPADINQPDALILPGSKNVPADMNHLREKGFADRISELAARGRTEIVGVCGGFQMIGRWIADPHHLESLADGMEGLGFLDYETTLAQEKTLTRVSGMHLESDEPVVGYEIHHGRTETKDAEPILRRNDGEIIGVRSADGLVWGTYLHGIFDTDGFRRWFVDGLRKRRGLEPLGEIRAVYDLEPAFDRLADVVRNGLDMKKIYELLGI